MSSKTSYKLQEKKICELLAPYLRAKNPLQRFGLRDKFWIRRYNLKLKDILKEYRYSFSFRYMKIRFKKLTYKITMSVFRTNGVQWEFLLSRITVNLKQYITTMQTLKRWLQFRLTGNTFILQRDYAQTHAESWLKTWF